MPYLKSPVSNKILKKQIFRKKKTTETQQGNENVDLGTKPQIWRH